MALPDMPQSAPQLSVWLSKHRHELLVRTTFQCMHASRESGRPTADEIMEKGTRVLEDMIREYARAEEGC